VGISGRLFDLWEEEEGTPLKAAAVVAKYLEGASAKL
jgi:hypothetical protein